MIGMAKEPTKPKKLTPLQKRLKALRAKTGWTQAEAAAKISVTRRAWVAWENDGNIPSPPFATLLQQLCDHPENF